MPALRDHLDSSNDKHPWSQVRETLSHQNHLRAFGLTFAIMFGSFSVIPYISLYLNANCGVSEKSLPLLFVVGGILTLIGAPLIGRLADRHGKLPVYRVIATLAAVMMLILTNLPPVRLALAVGVTGCLMLCNAGRMVAGLAIVTGSVEPRMRGGFLSANSAIQHLASGLGAAIAGRIIRTVPDGSLAHYDVVGIIATLATLLSLWLAGRVRLASAGHVHSMNEDIPLEDVACPAHPDTPQGLAPGAP